MIWRHQELCRRTVSALARQLEVSEVVAGLLVQRGLSDPDEAELFLHPQLAQLDDPFRITNLAAAADRLLRAMAAGERILILGDYDVDGVTSTVLLVSIMRVFGIFPRYMVPLRLEEGYGLTQEVVERALAEAPVDLFIALDCGTNSVDEVRYLRQQGADVIIVDHHRSKEDLPEDCLLVNPHVHDGENQPWSQLCTVGLAFKLAHGMLKRLRAQGDETAMRVRLKDYLDLVALGTVADLVPLIAENRIMARYGLRSLQNCQRQGILALFEASGLTLGQEITPVDISFRLGPRINASGRLADASVPIEMLLSEDWSMCSRLAGMLNDVNRERQEIERGITGDAEAKVLQEQPDACAVVLFGEFWHPGVVGIVAGKLARRFRRPCVVLGQEGNCAKGSARSIEGINLVEALQSCNHLLEAWGGHPMATGVSVPMENLEDFRAAFTKAVQHQILAGLPEVAVEVSFWIRPDELGPDLLNQLALLHPFGEANPEPIIGVRNVCMEFPPEEFGTHNYRFQVPVGAGRWVSGVAWRKADKIPPHGELLDLAVKLNWNQWNGRRYPQVEMVDWRPSRPETFAKNSGT